MYKFIKTLAVSNSCSVMEAETISKLGESEKLN